MASNKRKKLKLDTEIIFQLENIIKCRKESAGKVRRAKIILMYHRGIIIAEICRRFQTNRPLVERTIDKALEFGAVAALVDLPRAGRPREITDDAISWVLDIACQRPADFGYAAEIWTYSELIKHIKLNCHAAGMKCLSNIGKGLLNKILAKSNIKPHKISYYLEKRDPEFEEKKANILCVYKEVSEMNEKKAQEKKTTVSYDEKPGIQAIKNIAPQLPPVPGKYKNIMRDSEYKRLGTVSLLAGIDLHSGKIIPLVKERHRSREFIEFLKILNNEYPADWKIRIVLDNHSAHISKETRTYLKTNQNRFDFVFTPKHGSWLNMIEMFFSKIARSFLRKIRVESKEELIERIYKGIAELNADPVVFKWKYKMDEIKLA